MCCISVLVSTIFWGQAPKPPFTIGLNIFICLPNNLKLITSPFTIRKNLQFLHVDKLKLINFPHQNSTIWGKELLVKLARKIPQNSVLLHFYQFIASINHTWCYQKYCSTYCVIVQRIVTYRINILIQSSIKLTYFQPVFRNHGVTIWCGWCRWFVEEILAKNMGVTSPH